MKGSTLGRRRRDSSSGDSESSRGSKRLDRSSIEGKALGYLERFDASASRLRRVLRTFVTRRARELGLEAAPYLEMSEEVVKRYQASGLLDDHRYGTAMATSLSERGASRQMIQVKLRSRGLESDVVQAVTKTLLAQGHSELTAARALVRKRRLGNHRPESERRSQYRHDLGILARAGFDFDTAKRALTVEGADEDGEF